MNDNPLKVDMVKDPTKVKPKFIGSFTKRQVVCYGLAALIGIPFYLMTKDTIGKETAALFMVALMFPFIIASMYEKDGLPAERYFFRFFLWKFIRPVKRNYKKENRFEREAKRKQMEKEVRSLERKQKKKGLTIKEQLQKRHLTRLLTGKAKERTKDISVQETITFEQMSPDGICLVKPGYYTRMIEFYDTNYKLLDTEARKRMLEKYSEILNSFDPDVKVQLFLFNHLTDTRKVMEKFNVPLRNDGHDSLREEYSELLKNLYSTSTEGVRKSRYFIIGVEAKNLKEARSRLEDIVTNVFDGFDKMGVIARVVDGTERVKLLYEYFNQYNPEGFSFSYQDMKETGDGVKDYIAPQKLDFGRAGIAKTGDTYICTRYLDLECASLNETHMESLLEPNLCFSVSMHMQTIEPEKALKMTRKSLTDVQSSKINQQKKAFESGADNDVISNRIVQEEKNVNELLRNLNESNQKLINTTIIITTFGRTRKEAESVQEKVFSKFKAITCRSFVLKHTQEAAMNAGAPIGICNLEQQRKILTKDLGIFAPFRTQELFRDGELIYYGLNSLSKNMIVADRKQLTNPNGLILGASGSGKSFSAKREILGCYTCTGDDIIVCDPEGEYYTLVEAIGGTVVKLASSSKDFLNPMDITVKDRHDREELKIKSGFLITLCDCIAGGNAGLANDEKGIIDRCIDRVYDRYFEDPVPEKMPILEDLYNELIGYQPDYTLPQELTMAAKQKALRIANSLAMFVHGSQNYFNHRTNIDSHNRIICFDIRDLDSQLKELGMLIVQDAVWNRVSHNRERKVSTRYYCDEFHLLLKEKQTVKYSVEIWKRFRKWGGIPTGITQNVYDILSSSEVEAILSNSNFIYILMQQDNDRQILMEKLGLSETEMEYVIGARRGCGILRFGDAVLPFEDDYPRDTESYRMMSTKLNEEQEDEEKLLICQDDISKAEGENSEG